MRFRVNAPPAKFRFEYQVVSTPAAFVLSVYQ